MIIEVILFILGLFFLIRGSGIFVKSGATIARRFHVSELIIGLTLIALGTSLPELISSIIASSKKEGLLILGTIIGANIANLSLIIGIASLINPIKIKKEILKRDGYMVLFVIILLIFFSIDRIITRVEGGIFLFIFLAYNLFLIDSLKKIKKEYDFKEFTDYFFRFKYLSSIKDGLFIRTNNHSRKKIEHKKRHKEIIKNIIFLIFGGILIYFGAEYVVNEGLFFAKILGAGSFIMGVLISIGTTLPEMSVAISASKNKHGNITIGNSLGSCITNTLLIIGLSALIYPLKIINNTVYYSLGFLLLLTLIVLVFIRTDYEIKRREGVSLLLIYILFLILVLLKII